MVSEGRGETLLRMIPQQHSDLIQGMVSIQQQLPGIFHKGRLFVFPNRHAKELLKGDLQFIRIGGQLPAKLGKGIIGFIVRWQ